MMIIFSCIANLSTQEAGFRSLSGDPYSLRWVPFFPIKGFGYIRKVPPDLDGGPISRQDNKIIIHHYEHFPPIFSFLVHTTSCIHLLCLWHEQLLRQLPLIPRNILFFCTIQVSRLSLKCDSTKKPSNVLLSDICGVFISLTSKDHTI